MVTSETGNGKIHKEKDPGRLPESLERRMRGADPRSRDVSDRPKRDAKRLVRLARLRDKSRNVQPTGNIWVGGSGAMTGSRFEKWKKDQGSDSFTQSLVIETDPTSQAGAPNGIGFTNAQFLHINPSRVRAIVENPKRHPEIIRQTGLSDADSLALHRQLVKENVQHAGQVRSYGLLATLADLIAIRVALKGLIAKLLGNHGGLQHKLESDNRVQISSRLAINIVFSAAGGTGSSMVIPITCMIRELTKDIPCEITGVMILPSAFEGELEGKHEQLNRINANCYGLALELEAARTGVFSRERVQFGQNGSERYPVVSSLFNHLHAVGRVQADGKDLLSLDAVYDTVALHLAGVVGTEISDRVAADTANEASLKKLCPDPITKQQRYLSSLGAGAMSLDIERMSLRCAAEQIGEVISDCVFGAELPEDEVQAIVDEWLATPLTGQAVVVEPDRISRQLEHLVAAQTSAITRSLFRDQRGGRTLHFSNRKYLDQTQQARKKLGALIPSVDAKFFGVTTALGQQLGESLTMRLHELARGRGWTSVKQVCTRLHDLLQPITTRLSADAELEQNRSEQHAERLNEHKGALEGLLRGLLKSKRKQNRGAEILQDLMTAEVRCTVKKSLQRLFASLNTVVSTEREAAAKLLSNAAATHEKAEQMLEENIAGRRLTTASLAELDLSTPEIDEQLYTDASYTGEEFLHRLSSSWNRGRSQTVRQLVASREAYESAIELAVEHFADYLRSVSVVDVLALLLHDEATQGDALARLQHLFHGCQPLWRAESGQIGLDFSDSLMIGLPPSSSTESQSTVRAAIESLGVQLARANGQYNGSATYVETGDLSRIYAIRRCGGACFHYLPELVRAKDAYDQWNRNGGHSVHIFRSELLATVPSLIPVDFDDSEELRFALAIAFGWIAKRGGHWYDNIGYQGEGAFACNLVSEWPSIAFVDHGFNTGSKSLSALAAQRQIEYFCASQPDPEHEIGSSLEVARECVLNNQELLERYADAFDALRTAAGDDAVAQDLESYCVQVRKRYPPGDVHHELVSRIAESLAYQANQLRMQNG